MAERGIAEADVETALRQRIGDPLPGQSGTIVVQGYAAGGRILKVCVRTTDPGYVVTMYWVRPGGA